MVDPESDELVLVILSAEFRGVPLKSIARALSTLNGGAPAKETTGPVRVNGTVHPPRMSSSTGTQEQREKEGRRPMVHRKDGLILQQLREMLIELVEVSLSDIQPGSALDEIGIDSLMATEVLGEIRKRFNVTISLSDFQQAQDVHALARLIQGAGHPQGVDVPEESREEPLAPRSTAQPDVLSHVQEMLSSVIEVPLRDVAPEASLTELGVDSLLATEVLDEIKRRFHVAIPVSEFQELTDVQALCRRLQSASDSSPTSEDDDAVDDDDEEATPSSVTSGVPSPSFAQVAHARFGEVKTRFDGIAQETGFAGFSQSVYPLQSELVVAYVVEAFAALGCPLASSSPGQSLLAVKIDPGHRKLERQLYRILEDAQLIEHGAMGSYHRTAKPVPGPSAQALHEEILRRFPQHASEHQLLHTTGPHLAECLSGRVDPISLIFRDAQARRLLEDVYTNAPIFKSGTILASQYITAAFRSVDATHNRPIRVLELGAGTGGTTKYLVDQLAAAAAADQPFEYTFTDISPSMVAAAKKKFAQHAFMRYAVLDIEQDPPAALRGQFNLVISTNCIHATQNLARSCEHIKRLLHPDGVLCLVELTRNLFWFDLVFGLLEGWWLFNDGREHALAHESFWEQSLRRAGYTWMDWSDGSSQESSMLRVITASPSTDMLLDRRPAPTTVETVVFAQRGGQRAPGRHLLSGHDRELVPEASSG